MTGLLAGFEAIPDVYVMGYATRNCYNLNISFKYVEGGRFNYGHKVVLYHVALLYFSSALSHLMCMLEFR